MLFMKYLPNSSTMGDQPFFFPRIPTTRYNGGQEIETRSVEVPSLGHGLDSLSNGFITKTIEG